MARDIRLHTNFLTHFKTIRLKRHAGPAGIIRLLQLWLWAADVCPDGDLTGISDSELNEIMGWGDGSDFIGMLTESGFLDGEESARKVHGWGDAQPWLLDADERSKSAKKAAKSRWNRHLPNMRPHDAPASKKVMRPHNARIGTSRSDPDRSGTDKSNQSGVEFSKSFLAWWERWRKSPAHQLGSGPGGRGKAWKAWKTHVDAKEQGLLAATSNYLNDCVAGESKTQHAATWLANDWREWVDRRPRGIVDPRGSQATQNRRVESASDAIMAENEKRAQEVKPATDEERANVAALARSVAEKFGGTTR